MDVLQGAITVKGNSIPPQAAIEIEQYINDSVNEHMYALYGASVRVNLSYTETSTEPARILGKQVEITHSNRKG